jgi:hypothetical protein
LLVERNEMEKLYRGPYIDAYCQVWFHLAKLFQRRRLKYEKVNRRTTDAKWWQYLTWPFGSGELKSWNWVASKPCTSWSEVPLQPGVWRPLKLWGKWWKILHSGLLLAPNFSFEKMWFLLIVFIFYKILSIY